MAWNLAAADLPPEAKDYLSLLSSSGDETEARAEAGVSDADVRRWSRDDVFLDHRQQALGYFEDWKDWKPQAEESPGDGFIALEDMDPSEVRIASAQQGAHLRAAEGLA